MLHSSPPSYVLGKRMLYIYNENHATVEKSTLNVKQWNMVSQLKTGQTFIWMLYSEANEEVGISKPVFHFSRGDPTYWPWNNMGWSERTPSGTLHYFNNQVVNWRETFDIRFTYLISLSHCINTAVIDLIESPLLTRQVPLL